ncbi:MAG: hypothetical protein WBP45_03140 [Daejeonella sp.]
MADAGENPGKYIGGNEGGVIKSGGSYLENLTKYNQLFKADKISELFSELKKTTAFPKMGKTSVKNHSVLELEYKSRYGQNATNYPYSKSNSVTDFKLEETGYFVRLYDNIDDIDSRWIFRIEDLRKYKSVEDMTEKLGLPNRPSKIALVEVPAGSILRKSTAGAQEWANGLKQTGGGIQYEVTKPQESWFQNLSNIEDFFK